MPWAQNAMDRRDRIMPGTAMFTEAVADNSWPNALLLLFCQMITIDFATRIQE
jgi:hypothetical protein